MADKYWAVTLVTYETKKVKAPSYEKAKEMGEDFGSLESLSTPTESGDVRVEEW